MGSGSCWDRFETARKEKGTKRNPNDTIPSEGAVSAAVPSQRRTEDGVFSPEPSLPYRTVRYHTVGDEEGQEFSVPSDRIRQCPIRARCSTKALRAAFVCVCIFGSVAALLCSLQSRRSAGLEGCMWTGAILLAYHSPICDATWLEATGTAGALDLPYSISSIASIASISRLTSVCFIPAQTVEHFPRRAEG